MSIPLVGHKKEETDMYETQMNKIQEEAMKADIDTRKDAIIGSQRQTRQMQMLEYKGERARNSKAAS